MITKKMILIAAPILCFAFLLSGSCGGDPEQSVSPEAQGSSVIIVAIDGLRADQLGCYGGSIATPSFDALAAESVRFDQAWAQSPTMYPSLAGLLTGLYPTTNGFVEPGHRLPAEANTLAEAATAQGHTTAAFIKGSVEGDDFGLSQGFATYKIDPKPAPAALSWLEEHITEDVLVLIAGWSTADTSHIEENNQLDTVKAAYATHIGRIDTLLGQFIANLNTKGILDRTTLVILGTNGFAFDEHDNLFADSLYPAVTRVPLFIRYPGASHTEDVTKIVEVIDLMPTLIEAMGATLPEGVQGSNLTTIVKGEGQPPYIAFAETDQNSSRAVIMGGMQLVVDGENLWFADLENDPLALTDVSGEFEQRVEVMQKHLSAWSKMVSAASLDPARRTEEVDEETLEQLKSLGYVQ